MKTNDFLEQLDKQNFCVIENRAYGHISDYPLMITQYTGNKNLYTVQITLQAELQKQYAKDIKKKIKEAGVRAAIMKDILSFSYTRRKSEGIETVLGQIETVTRILLENRATPPRVCYICGKEGADTYILNNDRPHYDLAHSLCVENKRSELTEKAFENHGNYLTGILGALLGAFVGMIPALLGILVLKVVSAWLFMLIPLATYYGYKLFKGKMDIAAPICSVVFSLIGLAMMLIVFDITISMRYGCTFRDAVSNMYYYTFRHFSLKYWSWLSTNILMIAVYYLLGLAVSFGVIRRTNSTEVKSVDEMLKTKMPVIKVNPKQSASSENVAQPGQ